MIRTDETLVATSFAPNHLQPKMLAYIMECANLGVLPTDDNNGCGYDLYIACYPVANIRHLGIKGYVQPDAAENFHFFLEPLSRDIGVDRHAASMNDVRIGHHRSKTDVELRHRRVQIHIHGSLL